MASSAERFLGNTAAVGLALQTAGPNGTPIQGTFGGSIPAGQEEIATRCWAAAANGAIKYLINTDYYSTNTESAQTANDNAASQAVANAGGAAVHCTTDIAQGPTANQATSSGAQTYTQNGNDIRCQQNGNQCQDNNGNYSSYSGLSDQ